MAFRILTNGVVECDTIDELRKLQQQRPLERRQRQGGSSSKAILSDSANLLLLALLKSSSSLNTDEIAKALSIGPKSLPPVLRALKKWCQEKKLDFEGLITRRQAYVNRRPVTIYSLTDLGRTTFAGIAGIPPNPPAQNGKGLPMNTA